MAMQELLQLEDAAYAYRDDKGKVRIHQALSTTGAGAASGALWGTLLGICSSCPWPAWPSARNRAPPTG